jgi:hypothetical protein
MRIFALAFAALAALALTAIPGTATAEPIPTFDFSDCPALPAGAGPARWRCEAFVSQGALSFGKVRGLPLYEMRMTFAEAGLNGEFTQVFGTLRSVPTRIPGTPHSTIELLLRLPGQRPAQGRT